VRLLDEQTLYTRHGDWPGWLALAPVATGRVFQRTPGR